MTVFKTIKLGLCWNLNSSLKSLDPTLLRLESNLLNHGFRAHKSSQLETIFRVEVSMWVDPGFPAYKSLLLPWSQRFVRWAIGSTYRIVQYGIYQYIPVLRIRSHCFRIPGYGYWDMWVFLILSKQNYLCQFLTWFKHLVTLKVKDKKILFLPKL